MTVLAHSRLRGSRSMSAAAAKPVEAPSQNGAGGPTALHSTPASTLAATAIRPMPV